MVCTKIEYVNVGIPRTAKKGDTVRVYLEPHWPSPLCDGPRGRPCRIKGAAEDVKTGEIIASWDWKDGGRRYSDWLMSEPPPRPSFVFGIGTENDVRVCLEVQVKMGFPIAKWRSERRCRTISVKGPVSPPPPPEGEKKPWWQKKVKIPGTEKKVPVWQLGLGGAGALVVIDAITD